MLANLHAQIWNASEMGRAFGMSDHAVRGYLDLLEGSFAVRLLQPWHENLSKRQIKSPKLYLADSGIFHSLVDIRSSEDLKVSPKVGASWEGFALNQVIRHLGATSRECYFWRTVAGAELDLLVVRGRERVGFEFKRNSAPMMTPSLRIAQADLGLKSIQVIHPGEKRYPMAKGVEAVPLKALFS
jgi:predicted AAA+ superfamily ATPase